MYIKIYNNYNIFKEILVIFAMYELKFHDNSTASLGNILDIHIH